MAHELHLHLDVVVPDGTDLASLLGDLAGRELPAIPGSWIAHARRHDTCAAPPAADGEVAGVEDEWQDVLDAERDADAGLGQD